jgi:D-ribose pyranose/furanose isomerase RbsD
MKLLKQICNYLKKSKKEVKEVSRAETIKSNTVLLKSEKQSDINRWKDAKELFKDWNERTALLASYVKSNSAVIEFGAGNMSLRNLLHENCSYTPSDLVKRFEETVVCDLNLPISINLSSFDVAVFSGVLEYVYEIDAVFEQLQNNIHHVILSYACADICTHNRLGNGWLSDYTQDQLLAIFDRFGYQVVDKQEWRQQMIFNLKKPIQ